MPERHVYDRMFIHETLVDIVLDAVCARTVMESSGRVESWQRVEKVRMERQLETLAEMANGVVESVDGVDVEVDVEVAEMVRRIRRAHRIVMDMTAVVPEVRRIWRTGRRSSESVDGAYEEGLLGFEVADSQEEDCVDEFVDVER